MVVFGGLGTLYGAIIGTAAFLLTEEWLSGLTEHWKVVFGPLLVLVVVFARGGLVGLASQIAQALGDDPIGRGSEIAVKIPVDLRRYASKVVQELRNALIALAAQCEPAIQAMAARAMQRVRRAEEAIRRIAAQLAPKLQALQGSAGRLLRRLRDEIVELSTQLTRRFRGG
jgi:hypothetical protein